MVDAAILNFSIGPKRDLNSAPSDPRMANIHLRTKFEGLHWRPGYDRKDKFKMAAAAILNFTKNAILGISQPRIANNYLCTKFNTNIFIAARDMAENIG